MRDQPADLTADPQVKVSHDKTIFIAVNVNVNTTVFPVLYVQIHRNVHTCLCVRMPTCKEV